MNSSMLKMPLCEPDPPAACAWATLMKKSIELHLLHRSWLRHKGGDYTQTRPQNFRSGGEAPAAEVQRLPKASARRLRLQPCIELRRIRLERTGLDCGSDFAHEALVEVQIMDCIEPRAEDFIALVEMAQVAAAVVAAS